MNKPVVKASNKTNRKSKPKKIAQSPEERAQKKLKDDHRALIRSTFNRSGFSRVSGISDKEFEFEGQKGDFDDVFVHENVVIFAEYTVGQAARIGGHLKPKKILFDKVIGNQLEFLNYLQQKFPAIVPQLPKYHASQIILKIIYCARYDFDVSYKENVPGPVYMDYPIVRYFETVTDAVRKSTRFEILNFLGIELSKVGENGKINTSEALSQYSGLLLPEAHSNFEKGYKIVTFYADPDTLLRTAFVLRRDGWKDSISLYQRMISKTKIEAIRSYLKKQKRVFINNIIVTLPFETKTVDEKSNTVDPSTLSSVKPITLQLPSSANSVGIIDGQHRVFAYHESNEDDAEIAQLRRQQNLLVTGIIYPQNTSKSSKEKFEARLFLEINSTQTNAKSQLKHAIGQVLEPFESTSIASRVLNKLAQNGPLSGFVEQYFFDQGKLKPSSIISYGLKPLVKTSGNDSLFSIWEDPDRGDVAAGANEDALDRYEQFCVVKINVILASFRKNLVSARWDTNPRTERRALTTTYVNSFLITLRLLILRKRNTDYDSVEKALFGINEFDFGAYHSSQYNRMAEKIVETYFGLSTNQPPIPPAPAS